MTSLDNNILLVLEAALVVDAVALWAEDDTMDMERVPCRVKYS